MNYSLNDKITILVNSCDSYSDLWIPFFTLLKKHFAATDIRIILNTESEDFSFDGLSIDCVHPEDRNDPYGKRIMNAIKQVRTPYVFPLLDDFFLRRDVDINRLNEIIRWMDNDKSIVYFNALNISTFTDHEVDKYPGFKRLPNGNTYTLNMQAAVWRTEKYLYYWRPDVSPWDWEEFTNLIAARNKRDKFYCVTDTDKSFCCYGFDLKGMGVHRGKWVKDDVVPLFKKEGIDVDFSRRGFLSYDEKPTTDMGLRDSLKTIEPSNELIDRCLDPADRLKYAVFVRTNKVMGISRYSPAILYIKYSLAKERKSFIKRNNIRQKLTSIMK
ncbi:MAG: hypothetical protein IJM45_07895 [Clostridia bacterium]|nr:hypothetical protein [Clostridia bacterium]